MLLRIHPIFEIIFFIESSYSQQLVPIEVFPKAPVPTNVPPSSNFWNIQPATVYTAIVSNINQNKPTRISNDQPQPTSVKLSLNQLENQDNSQFTTGSAISSNSFGQNEPKNQSNDQLSKLPILASVTDSSSSNRNNDKNIPYYSQQQLLQLAKIFSDAYKLDTGSNFTPEQMNQMIKSLELVQQLARTNLTPEQRKEVLNVSKLGPDEIQNRGLISMAFDATSTGINTALNISLFPLRMLFMPLHLVTLPFRMVTWPIKIGIDVASTGFSVFRDFTSVATSFISTLFGG